MRIVCFHLYETSRQIHKDKMKIKGYQSLGKSGIESIIVTKLLFGLLIEFWK